MKKSWKFGAHKTRIILLSILTVFLFFIFALILAIKIVNPYKVSIYNYESYLSRNVIQKIKTKYSYHTFGEINEFTKAINSNKAVAGVGSDHQIAQLVIEGKLRKVNLEKVFGKEYDKTKYRTYKDYVYHFYEDILQKHLDEFHQKIIDEIKKINPENKIQFGSGLNSKKLAMPYLVDEDGKRWDPKGTKKPIAFEADSDLSKPDYCYDFLVPYLLQDKVIAYNTNKKYRPHLTNIDTIDMKNKEKWLDIMKELINKIHNYKKVNWTNSFLDNTMIGQFYAQEQGLKQYIDKNNKVSPLTLENYREIIDYFIEFVEKATGKSIKDPNYNKLVTDGLELVNDIIEPKPTKPDISIMYNGDALDSYYANDNFGVLNKPQIKYKRPKNNYLLLDAWIVSNNVSDKETDRLMYFFNKYVFHGYNWEKEKFILKYFKKVYENLMTNDHSLKQEYLKHLFENNDVNKPKNIQNIDKTFFKKYYDAFKDSFNFAPTVESFDAVNYTTGFKLLNQFLREHYFLKDDLTHDETARDIFTISNDPTKIIHQSYQPINLKLRTAINDYYFSKTKS